MNLTENNINRSSANYQIIIPISISCACISIIISSLIIILVYSRRHFHTITYLLICNTCISSIYYSLVQTINYLYLIYVSSDTSNISCRYRAYFGYMSIASIIYSYFIQALSKYFFSIFYPNCRWILSFRSHYVIIFLEWVILLILPLPSLITEDITYRSTFLCWVPNGKRLHVIYTVFAYYLIPVILIICIYLNIYKRVKRYGKTNLESIKKIQQKRNLKILRNILILISIYTLGAIPTLIYVTSKVEIFYSIGMIFLPLFVAIEKLVTILLDRELRHIIKDYFYRLRNRQILPIVSNPQDII